MQAEGAVYVAFGKALGEMRGKTMDVHGAGSQRSDPKTGEPTSRGPQGDMIRVDNYVRLVRGGNLEIATGELQENKYEYTNITTSTAGYATANEASNTKSNTPRNQTTVRSTHGNKFINRFDKNNDGKVDLSEFKAGETRFNHFDKNKDGYISASEAPTGPPKNARYLA